MREKRRGERAQGSRHAGPTQGVPWGPVGCEGSHCAHGRVDGHVDGGEDSQHSSERSSNSRSSSTGGVGRVACSHHTYICTGCEGGVPRGVREWSHGCVR